MKKYCFIYFLMLFVIPILLTSCGAQKGKNYKKNTSSSKSQQKKTTNRRCKKNHVVVVPAYEVGSIEDITEHLKYKDLDSYRPDIELAANTTIQLKLYMVRCTGYRKIKKNYVLKSSNPSIFTVENNNSIKIKSLPDNIISRKATLTVVDNRLKIATLDITVVRIPVCGNGLGRGLGISDQSKKNAKGPCLKASYGADYTIFTNSPSLALLKALNYSEDSNSPTNNIYQKADDTKNKYGRYANNGFVKFSGIGTKLNGRKNSQYDHLCKDYSNKNFLASDTWAIVDKMDYLKHFFTSYNKKARNIYGWIEGSYWTNDGVERFDTETYDPNSNTPTKSDKNITQYFNYASCVSYISTPFRKILSASGNVKLLNSLSEDLWDSIKSPNYKTGNRVFYNQLLTAPFSIVNNRNTLEDMLVTANIIVDALSSVTNAKKLTWKNWNALGIYDSKYRNSILNAYNGLVIISDISDIFKNILNKAIGKLVIVPNYELPKSMSINTKCDKTNIFEKFAKIKSIDIAANNRIAFSVFTVINDCKIIDITPYVHFSTTESNPRFSITSNGITTIQKIDKFENHSTISITASLKTLPSIKRQLLIKIVSIPVCGNGLDGHGINDTGEINALGPCIKIIKIVKNGTPSWYTSSPSQALLNVLGYKKDVDKSNNNYAGLEQDEDKKHTISLIGNRFPVFNQKSLFLNGSGGQYDDWCKHLATEKVAGKNGWRTASKDEMLALYKLEENGTEFANVFNWPSKFAYWTNTRTPNNSKPLYIVYSQKDVDKRSKDTKELVSCITK